MIQYSNSFSYDVLDKIDEVCQAAYLEYQWESRDLNCRQLPQIIVNIVESII